MAASAATYGASKNGALAPEGLRCQTKQSPSTSNPHVILNGVTRPFSSAMPSIAAGERSRMDPSSISSSSPNINLAANHLSSPSESSHFRYHSRFTRLPERGFMPKAKARIVNSEIVYRGPIFSVRRDEVIEPGGVQTTREVIMHSGSVVVLPVLPDKRIVMIRQYRHATRDFLWELVAGRMDGNETPKEAAARELLEETGYRARRFSVFLDVFPTPGFLEERMYILLAEGLTPGPAQPEADEKIEAHAYSLKELKQMLKQGKLHDAKSVAGILYYMNFLRKPARALR